jgi:hypothetical protein
MLFRETVAAYCENHTEHRYTLWAEYSLYKNSDRTSQETHYVSATKPHRLMLFNVRTTQSKHTVGKMLSSQC